MITHNNKHIFTIDQSGQKKDIFALKKSRVFSSLYIDLENNVTFLCGDDDPNYVPPKKWWVFYNGPASLMTIDMAGNVVRRESAFFPGTSCMEENLLPYIQEDKYALAYFRAEKSRDFFLHVVPRKPNVPQTKPEKFGTPYLFHDPNDVNFYYAIYGYLQETGEYLIAKKRVLTFIETPYTIDNLNAPWVELRRFAPKDPAKFAKINSIEKEFLMSNRFKLFFVAPLELDNTIQETISDLVEFGFKVPFVWYVTEKNRVRMPEIIDEAIALNRNSGFLLPLIEESFFERMEKSPSVTDYLDLLIDLYDRYPYYDDVFYPFNRAVGKSVNPRLVFNKQHYYWDSRTFSFLPVLPVKKAEEVLHFLFRTFLWQRWLVVKKFQEEQSKDCQKQCAAK